MASSNIRLFTVPNFITCLNLLAGCVGIVYGMLGNMSVAMVCLLLAAVFDFLDGFAARLLKSYSEVGVQLDSLADMVTFGLLPAVMLFRVLHNIVALADLPEYAMYAVGFSPFLLTVFSALRLAKFNVDNRQTSVFLGLPTPANGLFFSSFVLAYRDIWSDYIPAELAIYVIPALVVVFCLLLVSEIPMFSLKIKNFSLKKYAVQLLFILLSAAVLALTLEMEMLPAAFSVIILLYIVLSLLRWAFIKKEV